MVERGEDFKRIAVYAGLGLLGGVAMSIGMENMSQFNSVELTQALLVRFGDRPYSDILLREINQWTMREYYTSQVSRQVAGVVSICGGFLLAGLGTAGIGSFLRNRFISGGRNIAESITAEANISIPS